MHVVLPGVIANKAPIWRGGQRLMVLLEESVRLLDVSHPQSARCAPPAVVPMRSRRAWPRYTKYTLVSDLRRHTMRIGHLCVPAPRGASRYGRQ